MYTMAERMRTVVQGCTRENLLVEGFEKLWRSEPRPGTAATARFLAHPDSMERLQEHRE